MNRPAPRTTGAQRTARRRGAARPLGVAALAVVLLAVVGAWWALGGLEPPPPALTEAQARERIAVLAEKFDAALQNRRDASPLQPEVQRLVEAFPELADGHRLLGQLRSTQGDAEAALASFEVALALEPDSAALHILAGGMSEQLGRFDAAERHYGAARAAAPDDPATRVRLGNVAVKTQSWDLAEALLQDAIAADSTLHEAHALMAAVYAQRGDGDAALRSMEHAYELAQATGGEPLQKYALRLAAMLRERGDPVLAAKVLRLPESEDFFVPEIMAAHADALGAAGLPFQAAQYYEQWVRRDPVNADAAAAAVRWYLDADETDPARAMLVVLRRIDPRYPELPALEKRLRERPDVVRSPGR